MSITAFNTTVPLPASGSRVRSAAFSDPQVRASLARNRAVLRNAMQKTGDIKADVHFYVTIPYFTKNANMFASLKASGKRTQAGRELPSQQYGWFQSFFDKYVTNDIIRSNMNAIADPSRSKTPIQNLTSYKRKFGDSIRRWWIMNRNTVLAQAVQKYVVNGVLDGHIANVSSAALRGKQQNLPINKTTLGSNYASYVDALLNGLTLPALPSGNVRQGTTEIPSSSAPQ